MSTHKFTLEERLQVLAWIDEGSMARNAAAKFGVSPQTIRQWRIKLRANGVEAIGNQLKNKPYPMELMTRAVESYLAGEGSQDDICRKYGIRNRVQIKNQRNSRKRAPQEFILVISPINLTGETSLRQPLAIPYNSKHMPQQHYTPYLSFLRG